jgi:hypothetical protein
MNIPYDIKVTLHVATLKSIKECWLLRHNPYFRKRVRSYIEALRYLRS